MESRPVRGWILQSGVWILVGLFQVSDDLTRLHDWNGSPWIDILVVELFAAFLWSIATPIIIRLCRRFPIDRQNLRKRLPQHGLFSLILTAAMIAILCGVFFLIGVGKNLEVSLSTMFAGAVVSGLYQDSLRYAAVLGLWHAWHYRREYLERERLAVQLELHASELRSQLAEFQLGALRMQLQPHFIFNSMNAIMVLVRQQKDGVAGEMLGRLSELLAYTFQDCDAHEVPLCRDMEYIKRYLAIEQVRFPDRLRVDINVQADVSDAGVPYMCLQPIVENAIHHGISRSSAAGVLKIRAFRDGALVKIEVEDDGPGIDSIFQEKEGIGLSNTRARLLKLYGEGSGLSLQKLERGGTIATIKLPYHVMPSSHLAYLDL